MGGCRNISTAEMCLTNQWLYTARLSGGVPGFFVPLFSRFFIAGECRGYKAWCFTLSMFFHIAGTMLCSPSLLFLVSLLPNKTAQKRAASMI